MVNGFLQRDYQFHKFRLSSANEHRFARLTLNVLVQTCKNLKIEVFLNLKSYLQKVGAEQIASVIIISTNDK